MSKSVDTPKTPQTIEELHSEFRLRTDRLLAEMREKEAQWRDRLKELSSRKR
jgi:hypothetical protein